MEHSNEYNKFMKWLHSSPRERDGYWMNLFDHIDSQEREEMEDIIWEKFNQKSYIELAYYLPQLKKYDGISALKKKLSVCSIPSDNSLTIAKVLYDATHDDSYLDVFQKNYEKTKDYRYSIVARMSSCKPSKKLFDMLCGIYLNSGEHLEVQSAALGIWYYLKDIDANSISITEEVKCLEMVKPLIACEKSERKEQLDKLLQKYSYKK